MVVLPISALITVLTLSRHTGESQPTTAPAAAIDCGGRSSSTTGGSAEWPWNVAVFHRVDQTPPRFACGGTIIGKRFVLTAGRCTYLESKGRMLKPQELLIRAGIGNLQKLEGSLQQVGVDEIRRHEENDVAVLRTGSEFEATDYVRPLCLWSGGSAEEFVVGRSGVVAGWDRDSTDELMHRELKVVSRKSCRDSDPEYYTKYLKDRRMFCGTAAPGEVGAGLYLEDDQGKWSLRGVLSNDGRNTTDGYMVFVDVARYVPWISKATEVIPADVEDYSVCGQKPKSGIRSWPWQAVVYRESDLLCNAVIISERFLLAPASVFQGPDLRNPENLLIGFNALHKNEYILDQTRSVGRVLRHEKYNAASGDNNIALLQLEYPLKFSESYRPVCLWRNDPTDLSITQSKNNAEEMIESVDTNCTQTSSQFCISSKSLTAFNDSLYLENNGSWYVRGLTVNQSAEGDHSVTQLLDITSYTNWIDNNTVFRTKNLLNLANCAKRFINDYTFISASAEKLCYASHIRSNVLLSTASCLMNKSVDDLTGTTSGQSSKVESIEIHPFFNSTTKANNIAIVNLQQSLPGIPFCIQLEPSRKRSRLRTLFPSQGPDKYFFDLRTENSCSGGHLCGRLEGTEEYSGDEFCGMDFRGSQLFHDYGDGQGVYLRGLLDGDKQDHCGSPEVLESYVDVMFHAAWVQKVVNNEKGIDQSV